MEPQSTKRDRTLYEIATSFFAAVVIVFAIGGMLAAGLGDEGVWSAGFGICTLFLALGLGRLYLGLRRGNEGNEGARAQLPGPTRSNSSRPPANPPRKARPPARRRRP